jgi:hypothetical protein
MTTTTAGNPLPRVVHRVLQPADLAPGRVIIVSGQVLLDQAGVALSSCCLATHLSLSLPPGG